MSAYRGVQYCGQSKKVKVDAPETAERMTGVIRVEINRVCLRVCADLVDKRLRLYVLCAARAVRFGFVWWFMVVQAGRALKKWTHSDSF